MRRNNKSCNFVSSKKHWKMKLLQPRPHKMKPRNWLQQSLPNKRQRLKLLLRRRRKKRSIRLSKRLSKRLRRRRRPRSRVRYINLRSLSQKNSQRWTPYLSRNRLINLIKVLM